MPKGKKYGPEEIIPKLREAELLMSQGMTQELAAKTIEVSTQTLIRWRASTAATATAGSQLLRTVGG